MYQIQNDVGTLGIFYCSTEVNDWFIWQKRRQIDRTMIGLPTNFQHTAHIGSSDIDGSGGQVC